MSRIEAGFDPVFVDGFVMLPALGLLIAQFKLVGAKVAKGGAPAGWLGPGPGSPQRTRAESPLRRMTPPDVSNLRRQHSTL